MPVMRSPILKDQWIACFLAVSRYQTLSEAAAYLGLTLRTVQRNLKDLEKALGTSLFYYLEKDQPLLLTEGCAFHDQIIHIMAELRALSLDYKNQNQELLSTVKLAWDNVWLPKILPRFLEQLADEFLQLTPNIKRFAEQTALEQALLSGDIDIALTCRRIHHEQIASLEGQVSPFVIVGLPHLKTTSWSNLKFITLESTVLGSFYDSWDDVLYPRQIIMNSDNIDPTLDLCLSGLGAAWLPLCLVESLIHEHQLEIIAQAPQAYSLRSYLLWNRNKLTNTTLLSVLEILQGLIKQEACFSLAKT